jgi:predicted amidohydrolase
MNKLNISIIQSDIIWENKEVNIRYFEEQIEKIPQDTDLVLLPEMFSTGFSMNAPLLAEEEGGDTLKWMQKLAVNNNISIAGSIIVKENEGFFNRLYFVTPESYFKYDKRHLFCLSDEPEIYCKGNKRIVVDYKSWKICPLICYDLRFPVWSSNTNTEFDLLLYHANWPEQRNYEWNSLLIARAIENQSYVIGINRIGIDGNNIKYSGNSCCIDPYGKVIASLNPYEEGIINIELDILLLKELRTNFPVLKDKDKFTII